MIPLSLLGRHVLVLVGRVLLGLLYKFLLERLDVTLPALVLALGEVVDAGDVGLAGVILGVGKVVQVGDLGLPGVVLLAGPGVQSVDLLGPRLVLGVVLLVSPVEVVNTGLVILLSPLLQRLYLILPTTTVIFCANDIACRSYILFQYKKEFLT